MNAQPEALRLARELDDIHTTHVARNAAAELRRLHAENASLAAALASSCDEQRHELWESGGVAGCERALAAPKPVQKPVAWLQPKTVDGYSRPDLGYETCAKDDYGAFPVYHAPPQRKPLTEEEIFAIENNIPDDVVSDRHWTIWYARAIERAHGIGEQS